MKWTLTLTAGALLAGFLIGWQSAKNSGSGTPAGSVPISEAASLIAEREVQVLQLRQNLQRLALEANQMVSNRDVEIRRLMTPATNAPLK